MKHILGTIWNATSISVKSSVHQCTSTTVIKITFIFTQLKKLPPISCGHYTASCSEVNITYFTGQGAKKLVSDSLSLRKQTTLSDTTKGFPTRNAKCCLFSGGFCYRASIYWSRLAQRAIIEVFVGNSNYRKTIINPADQNSSWN